MQSFGEMVDVNFGQKPFCYDIKQELEVNPEKILNTKVEKLI